MKRVALISFLFFFSPNLPAQTTFWRQTNGPEGGDINSVALDPRGILYAGTSYGGVFQTAIPVPSWQQFGLEGQTVYALAAASGTGFLFAGTGDGVYRRLLVGGSWVPASLSGLRINSLSVDSLNTVFAGSYSQVFRSTDNGNSWTQTPLSVGVYALATSALNSSLAGTDLGVYRSTDEGLTWSQTGFHDTLVTHLAVSETGSIYASSYWETEMGFYSAVHRSTDDGVTWTQRLLSSRPVSAIATRGNTVYAATNHGLLRSTNDGSTWSLLGPSDTTFQSLVVLPGGSLLAASWSRGMFISTDNGSTWSQTNHGLVNTSVQSIALDTSGEILAGLDEFGGLSRSTNNGSSWTKTNFPDYPVYCVEFSAHGDILAGSLNAGGLYRSTDHVLHGRKSVLLVPFVEYWRVTPVEHSSLAQRVLCIVQPTTVFHGQRFCKSNRRTPSLWIPAALYSWPPIGAAFDAPPMMETPGFR